MATLMNYLDTVAPTIHWLNAVVSIWRLLQFVGPSLCVCYPGLWSDVDSGGGICGILSILWHFQPPPHFTDNGSYFNIAVASLIVIALVFFCGSSIYVQKYATLPRALPAVLTIWQTSLGMVLHPPAVETLGAQISVWISGSEPANAALVIGSAVVVVCAVVTWLLLYCLIIAPTLLFRPVPLVMAASEPVTVFFIGQSAVSFLIGIGTFLAKLPMVVILVVCGLLYFALLFITFYYGGFAVLSHSIGYQAACVTGGIMCILVAIFRLSEQQLTLPILVCFALVFAAVVTYVLRMRVKRKRLLLLDWVLEDRDRCNEIQSVNQWVNVTIEGFRVGHPVCVDWTILKWGVEKWPSSPIAWFFYAKFICIFPEQSQTLAWIYRTVVSNKVKGGAVRTVKAQSLSIARQREANLGPDLKHHLRHFAKQLTGAKHKLRRVWDLAIQSNTVDMDEATKRALEALDECDASMRHIARQFPNNRFVTRQYARFAEELLADAPLAAEMIEKSRLLQREVPVNRDKAHEWGTHAFPHLPDKTTPERSAVSPESISLGEASEVDPEGMTAESDDGAVLISEYISTVTFPGVRQAIMIQLLLFVLFICIEIPVLLVLAKSVEENMLHPLPYFSSQALLRAESYVISALCQQVIYTRLEPMEVDGRTFTPPPPPPSNAERIPTRFGGEWEVGSMLTHWARRLGATLQDLMDFRSWDSGNDHVKASQRLLFDSIHEFIYFQGGNRSPTMVSLQVALVNILGAQASIASWETTTPQHISGSEFRNTNYNIPVLTPVLQTAIDELVLYVQEHNDNIEFVYTIVIYVSMGVGALAILVCLVLEITWIRGNKDKVYTCLTSLPKTNVSQIAENLRVRKRESEDTSTTNSETSKQDDNIMKIFVAGGSSGFSGWLDHLLMIICVVLTVVAFVVCMYYLQVLIADQTLVVTSSSPHLTYLLGAFGALFQALTDMMMMAFFETPYQNHLWTKSDLTDRFEELIGRFNIMYVSVRFGNSTAGIPPYEGYAAASSQAAVNLRCQNELAIPHTYEEATSCFMPDMVYGLMEALFESRVEVYRRNPSQVGLEDSSAVQSVVSLLVYPIFELLVEPMYEVVESTINHQLVELTADAYPIFIVLIILAVVFQAGSILEIISMQSHMRRALHFVLHCPASVVLQCPKVMSVLSGDFSVRRRDEGAKTSQFFRQVVMQIPDAILTIETGTMTIVSQNAAAERLFGEGTIGMRVANLFGPNWTGQVGHILEVSTDSKAVTAELEFQKDDTTTVNLETTVHAMQDSLVYVFRDTTSTVRYNALIRTERSKSDALLKSILPPSLVPRVQAGEKNISFSVASASIVFMDIVSFTPWCGSSTADKVMMTLNCLFKKFDSNCASQSTMTRIKCIGDCYVAAGGVFSDVNQPLEHAKQVVQFGLDCLQSVGELNAELNESLQIRVGVNTGGPIVAGVLGGGAAKPTFEILGPSINMAQQMEHTGVPMQVHISRPVYELIFGEGFAVKEKGSTEVKGGGSMVTYLVTERNPRQRS